MIRLTIAHEQARRSILASINDAPIGTRISIGPALRSLAQNDRLWALLTDVSQQVEWHGLRLTPEEWKIVFSASLKKQKVVPGLDGNFVVMGLSTSRMSKQELSDLMELISAFGAERNVVWGDVNG